jgi:hypothetical protein
VFDRARNVNEKGPDPKAGASPRLFPHGSYLRTSNAGAAGTLLKTRCFIIDHLPEFWP